jgi:OOP family OmpA-OmpF porin
VTKTFLATSTLVTSAYLLCSAAIADDTGFYVGVNGGRVLSSYTRSDLNSQAIYAYGTGFTLTSSSLRKDHAMWWADVGYWLSRNFALEAGYFNVGSLAYSVIGQQSYSDGSASSTDLRLNIKSRGPALAVVGMLPMSNFWELNARVGAYEGKTTTSYVSLFDGATGAAARKSDTSTSILAGIGTSFTLTDHCLLRLDYIRLEHLNEKLFNRSFNVSLVTGGVAYVF